MEAIGPTAFINIHSHHPGLPTDMSTFRLVNLKLEGEYNLGQEGQDRYSLGIHPWEVARLAKDNQVEQAIDKVACAMEQRHIWAIGEIGIDRQKRHQHSVDTQKQIFVQQLRLSIAHKRPVIIHAVRALSDILYYKRNFAEVPAWIIHGFNSSAEEGEKLWRAGIYLSFGASLFNLAMPASRTLSAMPLDYLFLESDEQESYSIEAIYRQAAAILAISVNELQEVIFSNFKRVFGAQMEEKGKKEKII